MKLNEIANPDLEVTDRPVTKDKMTPQHPQQWLVVLHNNDYVSAHLVIDILNDIFGHDRESAIQLMMQVHQHEKGPVKIYPSKDIAETKVNQAEQYAQRHSKTYHDSETPMFTVEEAD